MLSAWLELPGAADRLATWSQISGLDLARLGTTATAEEITDTAVTQPLVVAATLLAYEELTKRGLPQTAETIVAGHSVGEIAAYAIAGVISADDAVKLAATRGAEMAKACAVEPTGMSAVLGGDEAEVLARLESLDLVPANRNAAGQIVAAGAIAALEKLAEDPPAKARVRQLATAGAFHTQYMASALEGYAALGETLAARLTAFDIGADGALSNRRVWADIGPRVPDGICLDADGAIWVANPIAPECVRVGEGGKILEVIETGAPCYACMLGGDDGKLLFMLTAASSDHEAAAASATGKIVVAEVDSPRAGRP